MYIGCTNVHWWGWLVVSDDLERIVAEVPSDLKRLVDADKRTNKEVVEAALWNEFGGRKKSALEAKKEHKKDQLKAIEAAIESEKEDYERVKSEIEAINAQIESLKSEDEKYEDDLNALLSELEDGEHDRLIPSMVPVRDIADEHGEDAETVHADLKELAAEQDRRIFNTQFMDPREANQVNIADKELIGDAFEADSE